MHAAVGDSSVTSEKINSLRERCAHGVSAVEKQAEHLE